MSKINVSTITNRTGTSGPVLSGVTTATDGFHVTSGSVGIGTDNPSSTGSNYGSLDISGSSGGEIFLSEDGTSKGNLFNYSADTNLVGLAAVNASGQLLFSTGGYIERLRITSAGRVGIGTDVIPNNTKLLVAGTNSTNYLGLENITPSNSNASRWSFILFKGRKADSTVGTLATINAEHDGTGDDLKGSLVFDVHNGTDTVEAARFTSSGNLAFPNGQGIDFSATADGSGTTASEVLDDYEEGTWTPTLSFNGASTGITYGTQQGGTYTKTGRFVFLDVLITLSNKGSSTGLLNINNLPFANASYDNSRMHGGMTYYDNFANLNTAVYLYKGAGGQTSIDAFMLDASDGTASDNVNVGSSNLTNTTTFRAWVSYYTD